MPKNSFEFQVSTEKPKAIIFGPDYLTRPIASLFRQKGLSVQTNSPAQPNQSIDYIVDIQGNKNLINLAGQTNAKYLRLSIGEKPSALPENINWRTLQTDFIVGPDLPEQTFMGKLIKAAIKNEALVVPKERLYPLHVNDLASCCWQALVLPNTSKKHFLGLGEGVSGQRLADFLKNLGQVTKNIRVSTDLNVKKFDPDQVEVNYQNLNWRPNLNWQESVKKSFQAMWSDQLAKKPAGIKEKTKDEKLSSDSKIVDDYEQDVPEQPSEDKEEVIIIEEPVERKKDKLEPDIKDEIIKLDDIDKKFKEKQKIDQKPEFVWWHPLALFLFLSVSFIFSVWLKPALRLGLGFWHIKNAYGQIKEQNWEKGLEEVQKGKENLSFAENFLKNSNFSVLFFGYEELLAKTAEISVKSALTAETAIPFLKNSYFLSESILKNKEIDQQTAINDLIQYHNNLDFQLKELQALLESSWPKIPGRWQNTPQKLASKIDASRKSLIKTRRVLPYLPWIIGLDNQRKTFLVLLQNNMELRPTGGFIGSFALLSFENGQLLDFQVQDVYSADGQLKGHVEPPTQIKEILGEAKWYLRDSNWNPDFPKTAENTEWFLEKSLNRKVDGVIAFNLEAAKKIISAFGEIYLSDFNEKVSADNIFERAEFWSENESFPGSNQKSAFLGVMGQQIFENIKASRPEEYSKLGQSFLEALEEKEIFINTHNDQLNRALQELNWDGSIRNPQCSLENCFTDYLHLNEANLGVNKANYFLRRSIEKKITLNKERIDHQLKINYENTADSKNWPGGDYTAWLRVYLPVGTQIDNIYYYNKENSQNKKIIEHDQIEEKVEAGKQVIGFKITVPIQERQTLEINFHQKTLINEGSFGYLLYWQKQSGYRNTPVSLLIDFPSNWHPVQVNPAANVVSGKLLFNQQLNKDLSFGIQFSK
jgi:hypothetical protein